MVDPNENGHGDRGQLKASLGKVTSFSLKGHKDAKEEREEGRTLQAVGVVRGKTWR